MIDIGSTAKSLRESVGWTQRRTADALGVSPVHLCNFEKGKVPLTPSMLEKYRELWGIDLYVLAWCEHGDPSELPAAVRTAAEKLAEVWKRRVAETVDVQRNPGVARC